MTESHAVKVKQSGGQRSGSGRKRHNEAQDNGPLINLHIKVSARYKAYIDSCSASQREVVEQALEQACNVPKRWDRAKYG